MTERTDPPAEARAKHVAEVQYLIENSDRYATPPSPSGLALETTEEERVHWQKLAEADSRPNAEIILILLRDFDRLLAREAKAREEERERAAAVAKEILHQLSLTETGEKVAAAIRARSKP